MPAQIGLALHPQTHDLFLDASNNLVLARDAAAIGEHAKQRMKMFVGEWFLDTTAGLPWLPRPGAFAIFDRPYLAGQSEALIKAEILDTPGVVGIERFEARVDRATRGLVIDAEIVTAFDTAAITAEVTL
jgi:hypothetical protein